MNNFEIIKNIFLQRENRINGESESKQEYIIEEECSFIDVYDLYRYEMTKKGSDFYGGIQKRILITSKKIEPLGKYINLLYRIEIPISYGGKDYTLQSDNTITLQFNELGDTGNRYILHRCFEKDVQSLDVHHKVYRTKNGVLIEPWQYDDSDLETLCHGCHLKKHKLPIQVSM